MEVTNKKKKTISMALLVVVVEALTITTKVAAAEYDPVIGIDLGTSESRVAVYKNGRPVIVENENGNRMTPSWVASRRLIGDAAKNQASSNRERTIFNVKLLLGRRFDDPVVQREIKFLPYKVVNKDGKPYIEVKVRNETQMISPEEISAMILGKMKAIAEGFLGKEVKGAVVTVPAHFNDAQRQATKDACTIAGFNVARLVNEPTAAAIAYALNKKEKSILVNDLGGGTFLVSFLANNNGVFEVKATSGEWVDFDHKLIHYFINFIKRKYNKDISKYDKVLRKLHKELERAKRGWSIQNRIRVNLKPQFDDLLFLDGTPLSLGIEFPVGTVTQMIPRNTPIPTKRSLVVTMYRDQQTSAKFRVDAKGILHVKAKDIATNKSESRTITNWHLTLEDVDRMVKEAGKFAEEDDKLNGRINAREEFRTSVDERKIKVNGELAEIDSYLKRKIGSTLQEAAAWLYDVQNIKKNEFDEKLKKLEAVWKTVCSRHDLGLPLNPRGQPERLILVIRSALIQMNHEVGNSDSYHKEKIENIIMEALKWLDDNRNAKYEDIVKKLEEVPITHQLLDSISASIRDEL